MRLIRGRSLQDLLQAADGLDARLALLRPFVDACQAVAYAHSVGIVHRDLKPANIMLGEFGETQVVDWGLARPVASGRGDDWRDAILPDADLTQKVSGSVNGTPAYMSPEQASGEAADERSDVWGLGAVLYELLTGRPPYTGTDARSVLKSLRTRVPDPIPAPAPPELVAVVERALRRDPEERYPNARAFAADALRYLDGRQVQAYAYSPGDHLRRFVMARKIQVGTVAVALAAIIALAVTTAQRTASERDRAQQAEERMGEALQEADASLALALVRQALVSAASGERAEAEVLAANALALGESPDARGVFAAFGGERPELLSVEDASGMDCRQYKHHLNDAGDRVLCLGDTRVSLWSVAPLAELWSKPLAAEFGSFNEGRDEVILSGRELTDRFVFLRVEDGSLLREFDAAPPSGMVFSRDGKHGFFRTGAQPFTLLADRFDMQPNAAGPRAAFHDFCRGGAVGVGPLGPTQLLWACKQSPGIRIGTPAGLERTVELTGAPDMAAAYRLVPTSDQKRVVIADHRGNLTLLDLQTGDTLRTTETGLGGLVDVALSDDDQVLAVAGERGGVRLWHLPTGAWVGSLPTGVVHQLHFDGDVLVVLGPTLQRWAIPKELVPTKLVNHGGFTGIAFSPDGRFLCGSGGDGRLRVWSMANGPDGVLAETLVTLVAQNGVAKDCGFTADSSHALGVGMGKGGVMRYRTDDWTPDASLMLHPDDYAALRRVVSLQGLVLGLSYLDGGPELWREGEPRTIDSVRIPGRQFVEAESNVVGTAAALSDDEGQVYRLLAGDPPVLRDIPRVEAVLGVAITNDADRIAVSTPSGVDLFSVQENAVVRSFGPLTRGAKDLAFSPDDRYLAAGLTGGVVRIWEVESGELLAILRGHTEQVVSVAFSPDGHWLATGSWDGTIRLWGLDALHTPAEELVPLVETAWQLSLEDALSAE
jgi:eukaryotic-like serine/threonine-protein kinase